MLARLAAPYLAVGIFWCVLHNAWFTILAYHAQILWWSRRTRPDLGTSRPNRLTHFVSLSVLAGPVMYFLLPYMTRTDLAGWLADHRLSGSGLVLMIVYYGLVHPVLEQTYWAPLRERTPVAHVAFAGYHLLVLYSLLAVPWLAACFAVLLGSSWMWARMARHSGGLRTAIASHLVADLGVVLAAWLRVRS